MGTDIKGFGDIFKSSFINNITSVSILDMIIAFALAIVLGLFIMEVYKKTFKGVMYSSSFAVSLLALTLITTLIILAVTSNVILSLGMVGALSIVRFRSAIKEPLDIAFLFWSISVGIVLGAGLIPLAIIGSICIGVILVLFINKKSVDNPYILIFNCKDEDCENKVMELVKQSTNKNIVKSKTVSAEIGIEVTTEVKLKDKETNFINEISSYAGVSNVVLVSYNGDYMA